MYFPSEVHVFQDGQRRILFQVEDLRFFEIDDLTEAILGVCEGLSVEEVTGALSDRWPAEDIEAVLEEMEEAGIVSRGLPPLPMSDTADILLRQEAPVSVTLHVSHACNLKCVYCFADGGAYGGKALQMKPDVAHRAVDWVLNRCRSVGRSHINFFGGEPLLNFPLIRDVVRYGRERATEIGLHLTFGITTNGTLLSEEIIDFLAKEEVTVVISLDGPGRDSQALRPFHDGQGSYEIVSENARRMIAASPGKVIVRATLTSCNMDMAGTVQGLSELGEARAVHVGALNETPDRPWSIREEHLPAMRKHLREMRDYCTERLLGEACPPDLGRFEDMARQLLNRERAHFGCSAGRKLLAISVDGSIHYCSSLAGRPEFRLGDVSTGLDGERQQDLKERFHIDQRASCQSCWARNLCGGGCAHDATLATGDPFTPNPVSCELRRQSYELAMGMCIVLQERGQEVVVRRYLRREEVPA